MINFQSNGIKHYLALLAFIILGIAADKVPLNAIVGGAGASLTFFDIFVAVPIMLLGLVNAIAAIIIAKLLSIIISSKQLDAIALLRLLPPIAAAMFFWAYSNCQKKGTRNAVLIALPAIMILLFVLHPAIFGTSAMLYSLWWFIPPATALLGQELADKIVRGVLALLALGLTAIFFGILQAPGSMPIALIGPSAAIAWAVAIAPIRFSARAYGATFSQHALGSVLFLYTMPALQNPQIWLGLIPIVALERTILGGGLHFMASGVEVLLARMALLRKNIAKKAAIKEAPMPHKKTGKE
jgi:hypothetical protein